MQGQPPPDQAAHTKATEILTIPSGKTDCCLRSPLLSDQAAQTESEVAHAKAFPIADQGYLQLTCISLHFK